MARGGFRRPGGEQVLRLRAQAGAFRAPARVTFFCCQKKVTKENHLDLRFKGPWARYGSCRFGGVYSRAGCSGHHCRSKGLCLRSPARRLPRPLAPATVGVFASTGLAIIKSRPLRREAPQWVGVPVGHGYNYFLACDTAERIIFAVVAGSGSGKLCWHSRGNDSDQENAGYVRESAGGSEQALRAEEVQKRSFCRCFWLLLSPQTKVARAGARNYPRRRQIMRLRRCAATPHLPRLRRATCLPAGRSAGLTRHRRVIQHRVPIKGEGFGGWR